MAAVGRPVLSALLLREHVASLQLSKVAGLSGTSTTRLDIDVTKSFGAVLKRRSAGMRVRPRFTSPCFSPDIPTLIPLRVRRAMAQAADYSMADTNPITNTTIQLRSLTPAKAIRPISLNPCLSCLSFVCLKALHSHSSHVFSWWQDYG